MENHVEKSMGNGMHPGVSGFAGNNLGLRALFDGGSTCGAKA